MEHVSIEAQKILKQLEGKLLRQKQAVISTEEHMKIIQQQLDLFKK